MAVMAAAAIGGGLSLAGGLFGGKSAKKAAAASAAAQLESAKIAADAQKFRPVGITSRFGSSDFQFDKNGYLTGAGYQLDPQMAAMRDQALGQASGQGMEWAQQAGAAGQGLFGMGQNYIDSAVDPRMAAQSWMAKQQDLLAPARERSLAGVRNGLFNTGRGGLSVGATGVRPGGGAGLGASNPEMEAYFNSIAQQDAQLATQADQYGIKQQMDQINFGQGLFGKGIDLASLGYNPMKTGIGMGSMIENLGSGTLDLGAQLGGRAAQAGNAVGDTLLRGGMSAAQTLQGPASYSPWGAALQGLGNNQQFTGAMGGMFSGQNQGGWGGWQSGLGTGYAPGGDQLYG